MNKTKEYFSYSVYYDTMKHIPTTYSGLIKFLAACKIATAQFTLAKMYEHGKGVRKSKKKTLYYYTLAANQECSGAQNNLALMYDHGKGVKQDKKQAIDLYTKAAEQGLKQAQFNLGVVYSYGQGVRENKKKAVYWFKKAAKQGHERAITLLDIKFDIKYRRG